MAVELLGGNVFPHVVIVAVVACIASGHRSIYPAQRVGRAKLATKDHEEIPIREWDDARDEHVTDSLRPQTTPTTIPTTRTDHRDA